MSRHAAPQRLSFWLLALLLLFAPLFRAGNRPLPLTVLELLSLGLLVLALYQGDYRHHLGRAARAGVWGLLLLPLLYLLPLGPTLWAALPGRELYLDVLTAGGVTADADLRLSLVPWRTQAAALAALLPAAVFLSAVALPTAQLQRLLLLVLLIGAAQGVLALLQFADGPDSVLRFGNPYNPNSGSGTYANRNHLAGLLEMLLPVALALLAATAGQGKRRQWRQRLAFAGSVRGQRAIIYAALALLLLLGLVFSRSRSGVILAALGIVIITLMMARRLGGDNVYGWLGSVAVVGFGLAAAIGLMPVLRRFARNEPLSEGRWTLFSNTLDGIKTFFPFGSGPGTFPEVYPRFQPAEFVGFVNHAHNDYLEWLFETGLAGLALLTLLLYCYLRHWPRLWLPGRWSIFRYAQAGAGVGMGLLLLHGLTDFNLRIPANMALFAFLAAVFFHRHDTEQQALTRRRSGRRTPTAVTPPPAATPAPVSNPFAD